MKLVALGDVCEVTTGQGAPQDPVAFGKTGLPFVRAGSLERLCEGYSEKSLELIPSEQAKKHRLRIFPENTIVFAKSGMSATLGRVYRLRQSCHVVSHLAAVLPSSGVDAGYLQRWFEANPPSRLIDNDAYPSIRTSTIQGLRIPLPSPSDQRRIAAILDKADALRAKRGEIAAKLNQLRQAVFVDMFGDPIRNNRGYPSRALSGLVDPSRGISYGVVQRGEDVEDGVPLIRIRDIEHGSISLVGLKKTAREIASQYRRTTLRGGELVISIRGTVGRCGLVPAALAGGNITRELALIPPDNIDAAFLLELLRTDAVQRHLARDVKGVAQRGINLKDLRELPIVLPPSVQVKAFSTCARSIEETEAAGRIAQCKTDAFISSFRMEAFGSA